MKIGSFIKLNAALFTMLIVPTLANAEQYDKAAKLINERLSYMKDVAGYKADNHLPIEDLVQEKRVLDQSIVEAEALGLRGDTVMPFITAQMDAAKAVQYRYRADWLSEQEGNWKPQDLKEVRLKLGVLNTEILKEIAAALRKSNNHAPSKCKYMRAVQQKNIKESDKKALCATLNKIRLKSPESF